MTELLARVATQKNNRLHIWVVLMMELWVILRPTDFDSFTNETKNTYLYEVVFQNKIPFGF